MSDKRSVEDIVDQIRSQVTEADVIAFDELISGGFQGGSAHAMGEAGRAEKAAKKQAAEKK